MPTDKQKIMNATISKKDFYQGAMYNGTLLGAVWSAMYILLFAGTTNLMSLFLCMVLFFSSPIIAVQLAGRFRKKECSDTMSYINAWSFVFYMYICATLLSALVSFLYFELIDGGRFFMRIQSMLEASMNAPGIDSTMTGQIEQTIKIIEQTTTSEFVWQMMSNNFFNAMILPVILALFVKRTR